VFGEMVGELRSAAAVLAFDGDDSNHGVPEGDANTVWLDLPLATGWTNSVNPRLQKGL
jgi:hypothetical protein